MYNEICRGSDNYKKIKFDKYWMNDEISYDGLSLLRRYAKEDDMDRYEEYYKEHYSKYTLSKFDKNEICKLNNEEGIIDYMNNYFVAVMGGNDVNYCELEYNRGKISGYIMRSKRGFINRLDNVMIKDGKSKSKKVSKIWLESRM